MRNFTFPFTCPCQLEHIRYQTKTIYSYHGVSPYAGEQQYGYVPEILVNSKKDLLAKIAYYDYTNTSRTNVDYATTQIMKWKTLGDKYISSSVPNYQGRKADTMAKVNKQDNFTFIITVSLYPVTIGDRITLTDSNGAPKDDFRNPMGTNATANHSGNTLKITSSKNSNDGTITFRKVPQNELVLPLFIRSPTLNSCRLRNAPMI